jgi:addiction module HigA family antidote
MTTNQHKKIPPVHPGTVLAEEFLEPMGLSQNQVAIAMQVPARRVNEIVRGKRSITADTALRLARYFDMSSQFWMNLQARYNLETTKDQKGAEIEKSVRPAMAE